MTKPIDEEELLLRIKALLRRARIVLDRRIEIGDVTLDCDSMTVSRRGEVQELPQMQQLSVGYFTISFPSSSASTVRMEPGATSAAMMRRAISVSTLLCR